MPTALTAILLLAAAGAARPQATASPSGRIGAFYFDGWAGPLTNFHFDGLVGTQYAGRRPLSGWRDHRPAAILAQLRWARAAGISFFVFDWFHAPHPANGPLNNAFDTYWTMRDRAGVGAAINYINHADFAIPAEDWPRMVERWVTQYFVRPQYVRVDGRPLLVILDSNGFIEQWGGANGANRAIAELRAAAVRHGLPGVFVVADRYLDWTSEHCFPRCMKTDSEFPLLDLDAITEFTYPRILEPQDGPRPYSEVAAAVLRAWNTVGERSPFPHIPGVMAGFDPRPILDTAAKDDWPHLDGHATWFETQPRDVAGLVRDAIAWVEARPHMRVEAAPAPPVVLIQSWNELQEGAILVPTDAQRYAYLEALAGAVGVAWMLPPKRSVRVTVPRGASVTSAPKGIACPPRCRAVFDEGLEVVLTARRSATGHAWRGGCRGFERSCSVVLVANADIRYRRG